MSQPSIPNQSTESPLQIVRRQIEFARGYSTQLIESVPLENWFEIPDGAVSHVAWQVGHLAMAQYGLTLLRIRGRERSDNEFIPKEFIRCFKKGTQPSSDAGVYPDADEIRSVFDNVHRQALKEMQSYQLEDLEESLPDPTAIFGTKLGSLFFCPMHEMMHAGQIGTLRRGVGFRAIAIAFRASAERSGGIVPNLWSTKVIRLAIGASHCRRGLRQSGTQ